MQKLVRVAGAAERIREAMDAKGIMQADLATSTGLSRSTISRYLSGQMEPKPKAIALLARELNVTEMWLWGYDVPQSRTTEQKKNDDLVKVIARLRSDPEFFDAVSQLGELPAGEYASIKQLISALGKK